MSHAHPRIRALLRHAYRASKPERQRSFRRNYNVVLARKACARRARPAADQSANQSALAAAGNSADDRAQARAAADESGSPFALAFLNPLQRIGTDLVGLTIGANRIEAKLEIRAALESSLWLRIHHRAGGTGTCMDHRLSIDFHGPRNRCRESFAGLTDLRSKILLDSHRKMCSCGDDGGRRRCGSGRWRCRLRWGCRRRLRRRRLCRRGR